MDATLAVNRQPARVWAFLQFPLTRIVIALVALALVLGVRRTAAKAAGLAPHSVPGVVGEVFALNLALAALAIASTMTASLTGRIALLLTGCFAVALVLIRFSRPR